VVERVTVFRNKEVIVAACIYIAARVENYPRTLDEIGAATNIATKEISRIQKLIISKLNIILCRLHPEHLLNRFSSRMQCNYQVNVISKEICSNLLSYELLESIPPQIVISGVIVLSMALLELSIDATRLLSIALINLSSLKLIVKQLLKLLKVILPERYQALKPDSIEDRLNSALNGNNSGGGGGGVEHEKKRDQGVVVSSSSSSVVVNSIDKNNDKKRYNNTVDNSNNDNNNDDNCCKRQHEKNKLQTTRSDVLPPSYSTTLHSNSSTTLHRNKDNAAVLEKDNHHVSLALKKQQQRDININHTSQSQRFASEIQSKEREDDNMTTISTTASSTIGLKRILENCC
jgi:hypothetical protein